MKEQQNQRGTEIKKNPSQDYEKSHQSEKSEKSFGSGAGGQNNQQNQRVDTNSGKNLGKAGGQSTGPARMDDEDLDEAASTNFDSSVRDGSQKSPTRRPHDSSEKSANI